MSDSIRSRIFKGAVSQAYSQVVTIIIQVTSIPLFLYFWGVQLYGEWIVLFTVPAYLALADFGFTTASTNEIAFKVSKGERGAALVVFQSGWALLLCATMAVFPLIVLGAAFLPIVDWFNFSSLEPDVVRTLFIVFAIHGFISLQTTYMYSPFYAEGDYGLGGAYLTTIRIFEFVLMAGALMMGLGPEIVAFAYLGGRLLGTLIMLRFLWSRYGWVRYGLSEISKTVLRELIRPSIAFMAFPIGNMLNLQGIILVIAAVIGPPGVVLFSALRTYTRLIYQMATSLASIIRPELSRAYGGNDQAMMQNLFMRLTQVNMWGAGGMAVVLAVLAPWLIPFWTGGEILPETGLLLVMLIAVLSNVMWRGALNVFYSTNNHIRISMAYIIIQGCMIILAWEGAQWLNLMGVVWALLIAELILGIIVNVSAIRFLSISMGAFFKKVMEPPLFIFDLIRTKH